MVVANENGLLLSLPWNLCTLSSVIASLLLLSSAEHQARMPMSPTSTTLDADLESLSLAGDLRQAPWTLLLHRQLTLL
jgi:hypothetical protein